jgi:hypothetical protein
MSRKGGKQRTSTQVENDRLKIAKLYLKGHSQAEIGKILNLHQTQVSKELAAIRERWKQKANIDFDEKQAIELERSELLEKKYLESYKRSQNKREITSKKKLPMIKVGDKWQIVKGKEYIKNSKNIVYVIVEETVTTENPDGNVRYLDGILKCINLRTRILGLQNGLSKSHSEENTKNEELNNKQRIELLMELLKKGDANLNWKDV